MPDAWYDPKELADQADGDKTQPAFDPPEDEYGDADTIDASDPDNSIRNIVTYTIALAADIQEKLGHTY